MAHGTGYYMERVYKADIMKKAYCVMVARKFYYYYEQMSDCVEPTREALDEYDIRVCEWREDRHGDMVADFLSTNIRTGDIGTEEAKKIWWNLKNREIPFETVKEYFIALAGKELTL